jgi:hypothetical protein
VVSQARENLAREKRRRLASRLPQYRIRSRAGAGLCDPTLHAANDDTGGSHPRMETRIQVQKMNAHFETAAAELREREFARLAAAVVPTLESLRSLTPNFVPR